MRKDAPIPLSRLRSAREPGSGLIRGRVDDGYDDDRPSVHIGRGRLRLGLAPSRWGDLFRVERGRGRAQAVAEFEQYLDEGPQLLAALDKLSGKRLLCHCRQNQACHGDAVIRKWRERCTSPPA